MNINKILIITSFFLIPEVSYQLWELKDLDQMSK